MRPTMLEISVLGELEVRGADGPVDLRARKLRQLLAVLLVRAGEVCSAEWLIDAIWEQAPPVSAAKLLQTYISRLRRLLPEDIHIRTSGSGYALEFDPAALDATEFERLAAQGRQALDGGNPLLAASCLRRATDLWRGPAYGELAGDPVISSEAARLEEMRLGVLEDRLEADLASGRHQEVIAEVCSLADRHPLRERFHVLAMLSLYRSGRQTEALDRFSQLRARLDEELGLEPSVEARDLQRRILNHDPSLAMTPPGSRLQELPIPTSDFIGRDRELDELAALLGAESARLIVLTGAGGSGKTRLAIEAARRSAHRFANGAAFVPLAAVADPTRLTSAIAHAVGLEDRGGHDPEHLIAFLRNLELLLVVDNAEHLRTAMPLLVTVLERAGRVKMVVTSRAVLHLTGEHVYPVRPLAPRDAEALFHQRARASAPEVELAETAAGAVEGICERVDRLPLAVELAASRMRTLSPEELLAVLDPRLPHLDRGPRDLPDRQRTMASTIAWSYDLLDEDLRGQFRRLAVVADGCSLEAAQAICDCNLAGIATLLDDNLLQRAVTAGASRYRMLETIREFAYARLTESGEHDAIALRHHQYFVQLAENCHLYAEAELPQDFDTANREQENFRAAISWARSHGHAESALRLVVSLENFWVSHDPTEGARLLTDLIDGDRPVPSDLRLRALRALGGATQVLGDLGAAERLYQTSRSLSSEAGDERSTAILDYRLGLIAVERGDTDRGARLLELCLGRFRDTGSRRGEAQTIGALGSVARARGDTRTAMRLFEQSAEMCAEIGRPWWQAVMLTNVAELALSVGDLPSAATHSARLVELAAHIGDGPRLRRGLRYAARAAERAGDAALAARIRAALDEESAGMRLPPGVEHGGIVGAVGWLPRSGASDGAGLISIDAVIDEVIQAG